MVKTADLQDVSNEAIMSNATITINSMKVSIHRKVKVANL
jgi:hypothetical protein